MLIKKKRKWLEENVAYQKEKKMIGRKRCYANVGNVKEKPTNKTEKQGLLLKEKRFPWEAAPGSTDVPGKSLPGNFSLKSMESLFCFHEKYMLKQGRVF